MPQEVDARKLHNYERAAQIEYHIRGFTNSILAKAAKHVARDEVLPEEKRELDRTVKGLMHQWVTVERDLLARLRRLAETEAEGLEFRLEAVEDLVCELLSAGTLSSSCWDLRATILRYGEAIDISKAAADDKVESAYKGVFENEQDDV